MLPVLRGQFSWDRKYSVKLLCALFLIATTISVEGWYKYEKRKATLFIEDKIILPIESIISSGLCELKPIESENFKKLSQSQDEPFFLQKSKKLGISLGFTENTGCMMNISFDIPMNQAICRELSDTGADCVKKSINYFWSEKHGSRKKGWSN